MGGLNRAGPDLRAALARLNNEREQTGRLWATRLQGQMEQAHPWTNRTGAAERGIFGRAVVTPEGGGTRITIIVGSHTPDGYALRRGEQQFHGFYLEAAHAGRWAVVRPTLDHELPALARDMRAGRISG